MSRRSSGCLLALAHLASLGAPTELPPFAWARLTIIGYRGVRKNRNRLRRHFLLPACFTILAIAIFGRRSRRAFW